jgi:hypothetical protein
MTGVTSNELARKPAVCAIAICGGSRCGARPSIYDLQGLGDPDDIILRMKEAPPDSGTPSWTEEAR